MTTPLGLAQQLRLAFRAFDEVRMLRDGPGRLHALCLLSADARVTTEDLATWTLQHVGVGVTVSFEQVEQLPLDLNDEQALVARSVVPAAVAMNSSGTNVGKTLRNLFPAEVAELVTRQAGELVLQIRNGVAADREQVLLDAARVLLPCDPVVLRIERQSASIGMGTGEAVTTYAQLADDRALLHEGLSSILSTGELGLPPLPAGASTYACVHDGVRSLLQRLALFDRVYVYMPFKTEDFPVWVGASRQEFLEVLPTGRVIPVFGQALERYEPGLMSDVLQAGAPRVVHKGEHALRMASSLREDHPLFSELDGETVKQAKEDLLTCTDSRSRWFLAYLDALRDVAEGLPAIALRGDSLAVGVHALAEWLDRISMSFGHPSRALEICGALEHRAINEGIGGVPMTQVGHYFDSCVRFAYGAEPGSNDVLRVPEPDMIGRICFPDMKGLTVREFAESFVGPRVTAMRELMSSRRVQTADGSVDLVRAFNAELKPYRRRAAVEYVAITSLMTVVGAFAVGIPMALAYFSLELARQVTARKVPAAFATFASTMTATTREAALLARIQSTG